MPVALATLSLNFGVACAPKLVTKTDFKKLGDDMESSIGVVLYRALTATGRNAVQLFPKRYVQGQDSS